MPAILDAKTKAKILRTIQKADDADAKARAFDEVAYPERGRAIVELVRKGDLDVAGDPDLWLAVARATEDLTAKDLLGLLSGVDKLPDCCIYPHLPFWPREFDEIVMSVACDTAKRAELVRGCAKVANNQMRSGLAWCLVRFGEDTRAMIGDQSAALAKTYNIRESVLWPEPWKDSTGKDRGLRTVGRRIWDNDTRSQTEWYAQMVSLLGNRETYVAALHKRVVADAKKGKSKDVHSGHARWRLEDIEPVLAIASDAELVGIFRWTISERAGIESALRRMKARFDDKVLGKLVPALRKAGAPNEMLLTLSLFGISSSLDQGARPAATLLDGLTLDREWESRVDSAIEGWVGKTPLGDPADTYPGLELAMGTFARMDAGDVDKILARAVSENPGAIAPFLAYAKDQALVDQVIAYAASSKYRSQSVAYGLGRLPVAAIPRLVAALDQVAGPYARAMLAAAITAILARTGASGQSWPEAYDRLLEAPHEVPGSHRMLHEAMRHLPIERARPVLLRLLAERTTPAEVTMVLWGVAAHATDPAVLDAFASRLVAAETDLKGHDLTTRLSLGLRQCTDPEAVIGAVLARGGGKYLGRTFEGVLGEKEYANLVARGGRASSDDPIARALEIAADVQVADSTVFGLRVTDKPASSHSRVGGLPPGITAKTWPRHDDEPMVHLFTVDFGSVTSKVEEPRMMSVFCARPSRNDATTPGTPWTAVVWQTAKEVARKSSAPKGVEVRPEQHLELVPIGVPADVWSAKSGAAGRLRDALRNLPAVALGQPLWLQGPEEDLDDDDFVMQFDSEFVSINLGDNGVMYVYQDTAFWQCH